MSHHCNQALPDFTVSKSPVGTQAEQASYVYKPGKYVLQFAAANASNTQIAEHDNANMQARARVPF